MLREEGRDEAPEPALIVAERQASAAAALGFDWPDVQGVLDKVHEELRELEEALALRQGPGDPAVRHELGDLLQALVNLGRWVGAPAEQVLQEANGRFQARFALVQALAHARGHALSELDDAALDQLWREAKRTLADPSRRPDRG